MNGENVFGKFDEVFGLRISEIMPQIIYDSINVINREYEMGTKSDRTAYAKKAFGEHYPSEIEDYSFAVDRITDVLDNFYDKESLDKHERLAYVVSIARDLWTCIDSLPENFMKELSRHLKTMVYIGVGEKMTVEGMNAAKDYDTLMKNATLNYSIRATVMDFFVRFPGLMLFENEDNIERLTKAGRYSRAGQIFYKDIRDMHEDEKNNIYTPVLIMSKKGVDIDDFKKLMMELVEGRFNALRAESSDRIEKDIIDGFYDIVQEEKQY